MEEVILCFKEAVLAALLLFAPIWGAIAINAVWKIVSDYKNSKRIAKRNAEKALREERCEEIERIKYLGESH